jgi:hypothetical protein
MKVQAFLISFSLVNIIDMNEKLTVVVPDFLLLNALLLVVGHDLLLCPRP